MFEPLIREAAARFDLGDNAGRLVRMLVDAIFDSGNGGFAGMRARFGDAGLGEAYASWIGTTPGDNVLQPGQFSTGFGAEAGGRIATRLDIPPATVNLAGAWLLPKIIGLLTRGGTLPTARPAEYDSWFAVPVRAAPAATTASTSDASGTHASATPVGGWWKWLLGLAVLVLLLFFGWRGCQGRDPAPADAAATTTRSAETSAQADPVWTHASGAAARVA